MIKLRRDETMWFTRHLLQSGIEAVIREDPLSAGVYLGMLVGLGYTVDSTTAQKKINEAHHTLFGRVLEMTDAWQAIDIEQTLRRLHKLQRLLRPGADAEQEQPDTAPASEQTEK